jgi:uncharacterized protein (DUF362 family)/Pyruvate/2-oxoacid:ferredoxin oxidoreductase delta subunit
LSKVALVRCESYEYKAVKDAVEKGLSLIGGIQLFVKDGEKILLKPNILSADTPEKSSITHYTVLEAVAQLFQSSGANLSYGDSPGIHKAEIAAQKTGMKSAMDSLSIPLADFEKGSEVYYERGIQNKKFIIANGVLESDGIISISKFKTHGLTRLTGAVKNQFGCVPGKLKAGFHVKISDPINFSKMLVDLNNYLKPRLYIMDGIVAMEGNGPRNGTPRQMNVLLFSTDPVALDATACRIIDLSPKYVPTCIYGKEFGLGTYLEEEIEIVGEKIENFKVSDFSVVKKPVGINPKLKFIAGVLKKIFVEKPFIKDEKCVKCGLCVDVCPVEPKALNWISDNKNIPPVYNYERCIRCFCCQELCPEGAVEIKIPFWKNSKKSNK